MCLNGYIDLVDTGTDFRYESIYLFIASPPCSLTLAAGSQTYEQKILYNGDAKVVKVTYLVHHRSCIFF